MNKPLILFVGQSGSGKTTIANHLEATKGYKQVQSYTTRKPRYEGEVGHTFVTKEEFNSLGNLVAYTRYNGNEYGVTAEMVDESDIYVIDVPGVETLLEKYSNKNRRIVILYFNSTVATRIDRMVERGDCDSAIISRLHADEQYDWLEKLNSIEWCFRHDRIVRLHVVNANLSQEKVAEEVLWYLE